MPASLEPLISPGRSGRHRCATASAKLGECQQAKGLCRVLCRLVASVNVVEIGV